MPPTPEQDAAWADPRSWYLFGTVYVNRADRRVFVPKRPPAAHAP